MSTGLEALRQLPFELPRYAQLFDRQCGEHQREHQRCLRKQKLDPLDMKAWYPPCGEAYELETSCALRLLRVVDVRCRAALEAAARVPKEVQQVGRCVGELQRDKALRVQADVEEARERYRLGKQMLAR